MTAPAWVKRLRPEGTSRKARLGVCRKCSALLIVGLDDHVAALTARADHVRVSTLGEVLALAQGRETYDLVWRGTRFELDRRDRWRIGGRPADSHPVVASHRCGDDLPALALRPGRPLARASPRIPTPDLPPF